MGPVNGSAVVAGDRTFVAGCDSDLHILDLKTGKEIAAIPLDGQAAATAAIDGDHAYVGTMANELLSVDLAKREVAWKFESKKSQPFYSSAAVKDDLVVVGCRDKQIHAVHRKTGQLVWSFATKSRVDSSPVFAGDRIYVGSSDGSLYVLERTKGTLIQRIELGRGVVAGPAIAHGRLVIGTTDGWLCCLGK